MVVFRLVEQVELGFKKQLFVVVGGGGDLQRSKALQTYKGKSTEDGQASAESTAALKGTHLCEGYGVWRWL